MNFSPSSRVWIYLSDRAFAESEVNSIQPLLDNFCKEWIAHGSSLFAKGEVRFNRFIILMVDETQADASGCSIDKSVAFIQSLEKKIDVHLFNRLLIAYMVNDEVRINSSSELQQLVQSGVINENTIVFNPAIPTKEKLDREWMVPFNQSWWYSKVKSFVG